MNFFSLEFYFCFLVLFFVYWCFRSSIKTQNGILLISSYLFISYFSIESAVILFSYSLLIDLYARAFAQTKREKTAYFALITLVCSFFIAFKYYPFSREGLEAYFDQIGVSLNLPILDILVPLGLSFYIFHSVSYAVDVIKGKLKPIPFTDLLLYLCFFPSVVAGPINRAKDFIGQIQSPTRRDISSVRTAIGLIALAIAKLFLGSAFLADNYINGVFDMPENYDSVQILTGIYAYAWQIYFNFSGYTNLVTGIAMLLGFTVPKNFDTPYIAKNLQEFWQRWHISLSLFIRDYIYIPLGGNRNGFINKNKNLMIAMVLSGIWHGAGMNFLVWGAVHGIGLLILNCKTKVLGTFKESHWSDFIGRFITFNYICLAWVFFRAKDLNNANSILQGMSELNFANSQTLLDFCPLILTFGLFLIYPWLVQSKEKISKTIHTIPWFVYPVPLVLFLSLVFVFAPSGIPGFIYANF